MTLWFLDGGSGDARQGRQLRAARASDPVLRVLLEQRPEHRRQDRARPQPGGRAAGGVRGRVDAGGAAGARCLGLMLVALYRHTSSLYQIADTFGASISGMTLRLDPTGGLR